MRLGEIKRYEKYKDSGVEWIGEVPEGWEVKKIKYTSYVKGRIGWQGLRADEFTNEGPYLITGMHFSDDKVDWDSCYHISEERYQQAHEIQIRENDLLITKDGTIGKVAYIDKLPGKASLNSHLLVIRPLNGEYLPRFLFWVFKANYFDYYVNLTQTGTTFFGITQEKVEDFIFVTPSIDEQKRISNFLDQKTSEIDSLIADKEKLIELLQEKRQAIISEAVTKGLDKNVKMKDSGIEWIGEVPERWKVVQLRYICDIKYGLSTELENGITDGYKIISLPNVLKNGNLVLDEVPLVQIDEYESKKYLLKKGDLLFNWRNGSADHVGKTALFEEEGKYLHVSFLLRIRFDQSKYYPRFFQSFLSHLRSIGFFGSSKSQVNKTYNQSELGKLIVVVPPYGEQREISEYLNTRTKEFDDLINEIEAQINKLKEYRQALISEAVTGKIMV